MPFKSVFSIKNAIILCCFVVMSLASIASGGDYSYYYKGELIKMSPSKNLIAVDQALDLNNSFEATGLVLKDALSQNKFLRQRGFVIYKRVLSKTDKAKGKKSAQLNIEDIATVAGNLMAPGGEIATQPVFEQGGGILIPFNELIVGFKNNTSLEEAEQFFNSKALDQGISKVKTHWGNSFILEIDNSGDGRAYDVSRSLAAFDEIEFAEPNHIVLESQQTKIENYSLESIKREKLEDTGKAIEADEGVYLDLPSETDTRHGSPSWTTIGNADFESSPPGWIVNVMAGGYTDAYWQIVSGGHNGSNGLFCAGGGSAGVAKNNLVPVNMFSVLRSPTYDLSSYEEVYFEVWFWTHNEIGVSSSSLKPYDFPALWIENGAGTSSQPVSYLIDLYGFQGGISESLLSSNDPTSSGGWFKLLYRVLPAYLTSTVTFYLSWSSDSSTQTYGCTLDDIRIVGSTDVDSAPISSDTFSGRIYEFSNSSQIAGLGSPNNDMAVYEAWGAVSVKNDVVVAVIDSGVDLLHPDLNLIQGYNGDGTLGGAPTGSSHGTNCAGNVGAIKDNNQGVVGVAPNVKIMPINKGGTEAYIANSIIIAITRGAQVLTNSWGWVGAPSTDISNAIGIALTNGRVVLFAAGNGPDRPPYSYDVAFPGNLTGSTDMITVGATGPQDDFKGMASSDGAFGWGTSYVGNGPDIYAPGPWSYTTDIMGNGTGASNDGTKLADSNYTPDFGGTSSSTPKVAGVVALILSKDPYLTPAQVKSILQSTSDSLTTKAPDGAGHGRVNAHAALNAVSLKNARISANGSFHTTNWYAGSNIEVAVAMDDTGYEGVNVDWWCVALAGGRILSYDISSRQFQSGLSPTATGPLADLGKYVVFSSDTLPPGTYDFYFGFDRIANGKFDGGAAVYSKVTVNVL